jgi:fatty acid desaturase
MDDVPREILQAAYVRKPIYLLKVPLHFALWVGMTFGLLKLYGTPWFIPAGIFVSVMVTHLMRGLGAVAHDCVHGTVFKSKTASYWFGLLCWAPTGMAFTIYSNYHMHHHRIANTYPDVDNFVVTDYTKNPVLAKALLLAVFSFGYPIYFLFQMFRYMGRLTAWKKVRMNLELVAWWAIVLVVAHFVPWEVFLFIYGLPFILGAMLASTTSLIEHYEMDPGEDAYSSRTYGTKMHLTNFLWNNVSFHNEHHKFPGIPWYNLRSFHEAAFPHYDERVQKECYPNFYGLVWKLWMRILELDIEKLEAKYAHLNREEERAKHMQLAGISPVA